MKIALVPMAAKPYHAGHDGLVRIAASECDEVHLFVSTSARERPGEMPISGEAMKRIWNNFIEPSLPSNVVVTYGGSPVGNVYAELESGESQKSKDTYVIYSDDTDIMKYTDDKLSKIAPKMFKRGQIELRGISREETVPVSGTEMRAMLAAGDVKAFSRFLPPSIQGNAREIIKILKSSIKESLLKQFIKSTLNTQL